MARYLVVGLVLAVCTPGWAQPGPGGSSPGPARIARPDFRPEVLPAIVEVEVTLAEWGAPMGEGAAKEKADELSGPSADVLARVAALEKQGQLAVVQRVRLTTLDGYKSFVQLGERRPRITSSTVMAAGRGTANSIVFENVGTLVSVAPHVHTSGQITLEIDVEKSGPRPRADAPVISESPMGEKVRAESTGTLTVQTSLRLSDGQTTLLAGATGGSERNVVLVGIKVVK